MLGAREIQDEAPEGRHSLRDRGLCPQCFAPPGLDRFDDWIPRAYALGYRLPRLRRYPSCALTVLKRELLPIFWIPETILKSPLAAAPAARNWR